jgi:hypothetical protein
VRRALVRLAGRTGRTNRHGVTTIEAPREKLEVAVSARGHSSAPFASTSARAAGGRSASTGRGCNGRSTARRPRGRRRRRRSRLHPPFRVVWSRGFDRLIEFPAVVDDGVAYIGNAAATVHAISMRSGAFAFRTASSA